MGLILYVDSYIPDKSGKSLLDASIGQRQEGGRVHG